MSSKGKNNISLFSCLSRPSRLSCPPNRPPSKAAFPFLTYSESTQLPQFISCSYLFPIVHFSRSKVHQPPSDTLTEKMLLSLTCHHHSSPKRFGKPVSDETANGSRRVGRSGVGVRQGEKMGEQADLGCRMNCKRGKREETEVSSPTVISSRWRVVSGWAGATSSETRRMSSSVEESPKLFYCHIVVRQAGLP